MSIIVTLRRIDFASFWLLLKLSIRHPMFLWPTFKATKECLQLSTRHFGRAHYQNTPANAFRHAFWNFIIAKKCTKWSKNIKTVLKWTKNITDWHENAFRNRDLARKMDFHNNKVGREVFRKHSENTQEEVINLFIEMTKNSIKITEHSVLKNHQLTLVHLTD